MGYQFSIGIDTLRDKNWKSRERPVNLLSITSSVENMEVPQDSHDCTNDDRQARRYLQITDGDSVTGRAQAGFVIGE